MRLSSIHSWKNAQEGNALACASDVHAEACDTAEEKVEQPVLGGSPHRLIFRSMGCALLALEAVQASEEQAPAALDRHGLLPLMELPVLRLRTRSPVRLGSVRLELTCRAQTAVPPAASQFTSCSRLSCCRASVSLSARLLKSAWPRDSTAVSGGDGPSGAAVKRHLERGMAPHQDVIERHV